MVDLLNRTIQRNPALIKDSVSLHQAGIIPSDTFVIDLDAIESNARIMSESARKIGVGLYYITKQFGRNPIVAKTIVKGGIRKAVVIDIDECRILHNYGLEIGHVGHLVQIPNRDLEFVLKEVRPEFVTVYDMPKAQLISEKAKELGLSQDILLKIHNNGDFSYPKQISAGGFNLKQIDDVFNSMNNNAGVKIRGVTGFPAFRADISKGIEVPTPNVKSLVEVSRKLRGFDADLKQMNLPADNSSVTLSLAKEVAEEFGDIVCVEPGHGISGTTPLHFLRDDLPEIPAVVYVSEISHSSGEDVYAYGGGMMGADSVLGLWSADYHFFMHALIGKDGQDIFTNRGLAKQVGFIDYYLPIQLGSPHTVKVGDTVVMGFRPQIFVTRSHVAVVKGIQKNTPELIGIFDSRGNLLDNKTLECKGTREAIEILGESV